MIPYWYSILLRIRKYRFCFRRREKDRDVGALRSILLSLSWSQKWSNISPSFFWGRWWLIQAPIATNNTSTTPCSFRVHVPHYFSINIIALHNCMIAVSLFISWLWFSLVECHLVFVSIKEYILCPQSAKQLYNTIEFRGVRFRRFCVTTYIHYLSNEYGQSLRASLFEFKFEQKIHLVWSTPMDKLNI